MACLDFYSDSRSLPTGCSQQTPRARVLEQKGWPEASQQPTSAADSSSRTCSSCCHIRPFFEKSCEVHLAWQTKVSVMFCFAALCYTLLFEARNRSRLKFNSACRGYDRFEGLGPAAERYDANTRPSTNGKVYAVEPR